jgi:hypothetical protein
MPALSIAAADHPVHVDRAAGCERVAGVDAFERIREQAHTALDAIRARCREDHNRIVKRLDATDATLPHSADKPLAAATAATTTQPRFPDGGWDADARIRISRAFAEALAEAPNEMAWSHDCADELLDDEQPRTGNEAGSIVVEVDDEQPDARFIVAAVDELKAGGWVASAADEHDTVSVAALAENKLNESAEVEAPPIAPIDLEVEEPPTAPVDLIEDRLQVEIDADDSADYPDGPLEETQPFAGSRHRRRARDWSLPCWPMSRLQTAILVLLVVDCILVGWRPEIVRALPQTSSFYKLVGLSVNLRGVAFDGVATTTEQHEGVPVLVVEGNIVNGARTVADVPRLKFIVRNATGQEIYSWTAVPSRTLLPPGEAVSFRTELASPPPDTHDVLLRLVDPRDIVAAER